jgi:hypothetical protein
LRARYLIHAPYFVHDSMPHSWLKLCRNYPFSFILFMAHETLYLIVFLSLLLLLSLSLSFSFSLSFSISISNPSFFVPSASWMILIVSKRKS